MAVGAGVEGSVSPRSNNLLNLLPDEAYAHLQSHLEYVRLPAGAALHEPGHALKYANFPVSGLIGRVGTTRDGRSTELTLSGSDGMIGFSILLGGRPLSSRALVLADSAGYRVPASVMLAAWRHSDAFQSLMLRFVQTTFQEVIQIALCNMHHSLEQRLSRWLLMAVDRLGEPRMHVTQSVISHLLGVRREGITEVAGKLEAQGILKRERGGMVISDRKALGDRSCECYGAITSNYERMVSDAQHGTLRTAEVYRYGK